jgi:dTDP-4-dehydrorhamnose 3,5-epimerase
MSKSFIENTLPLEGLIRLERSVKKDDRGSFERLFCDSELDYLLPENFSITQINRSFTSTCGTIRGLHFQRQPFSEIKVLSCLSGEIFDVTVDIRPESKTFLQWHGEVLTENSATSLLIPEGFAHGFQTLTDNCELIYFHSAPWNKAAEGGLNPFDQRLTIDWPVSVVKVSERDKKHAFLSDTNCKQLLKPTEAYKEEVTV